MTINDHHQRPAATGNFSFQQKKPIILRPGTGLSPFFCDYCPY
jgi:hypothetical protein